MIEIEKFIIERMEDKPTLSELYGGEITFGFSFVMELMEEWSKLHQPTVSVCACGSNEYYAEQYKDVTKYYCKSCHKKIINF